MTLVARGSRALVGMIHLPPLPGSTNYMGQPFNQIVEQAMRDARALHAAGFRAGMILKNDAPGALAVAAAVGAEFVRLKVYVGAVLGAEGVLAPSAADALRTRQRLGSNTEIWADLFDRTSVPLVPQPLEQLAEWATKFGGASVVIVTGDSWDSTIDMARTARSVLADTPVAIGGGVTLANVRAALDVADVAIVGSALEERPFTGPISATKARALAEQAGSGLLTR